MLSVVLAIVLTVGTHTVLGDLPVDCQYPKIVGKWRFHVGAGGHNNTIKCANFGHGTNLPVYSFTLDLYFPDVVIDQYGNRGFWTMVYNEGFEVQVDGMRYFAFSMYDEVSEASDSTSICDETIPGWSHDDMGNDWACYRGVKLEAGVSFIEPGQIKVTQPRHKSLKSKYFRTSTSLIKRINSQQKSWKAVKYTEFEGMKIEDMMKMTGGRSAVSARNAKPSAITTEQMEQAAQLPKSFDWRDVNGMDYVGPVGSQGMCGSCYIFSALGMMESRIRIKTNNTRKLRFSRQDVIECSHYSQGCQGGFEYLVGKYAADFGVVTEECHPYRAMDWDRCNTPRDCKRIYASNYEYLGGFYGGCNEALMRINLYKYGPISVGFQVHRDFMHYKSGIYHHVDSLLSSDGDYNPFQVTDHAVLVVGYGSHMNDKHEVEKYWIVQNSWGKKWGEKGYFRIRRGTNEVNIEGDATQLFPLV